LAQYTQRRPTEVAINNGHSKDTGNMWPNIHNEDQPRWQLIMDIPKTQTTFGTIYTMKTNRGGKHEWTIQRHRQHVAQYTEPRQTVVAIKNEQSKDTGNMWHTIDL
jgi:hypothetical protein